MRKTIYVVAGFLAAVAVASALGAGGATPTPETQQTYDTVKASLEAAFPPQIGSQYITGPAVVKETPPTSGPGYVWVEFPQNFPTSGNQTVLRVVVQSGAASQTTHYVEPVPNH